MNESSLSFLLYLIPIIFFMIGFWMGLSYYGKIRTQKILHGNGTEIVLCNPSIIGMYIFYGIIGGIIGAITGMNVNNILQLNIIVFTQLKTPS